MAGSYQSYLNAWIRIPNTDTDLGGPEYGSMYGSGSETLVGSVAEPGPTFLAGADLHKMEPEPNKISAPVSN